MVAKRLLAADAHTASGAAPRAAGVTNVVFMGMGEPLHNLPAVLAAVDILCDPLGLQLSHNKVRWESQSPAPADQALSGRTALLIKIMSFSYNRPRYFIAYTYSTSLARTAQLYCRFLHHAKQ